MTGKPWSVRYPFQPLADICRARHRPANADPQAATANLTDIGVVVAVTGMGHTSVSDWARRGVTEMGADRVAVTLGYHPMNIWPDWGRPSSMKRCANETCSQPATHKFCSRMCQNSARNTGDRGRHRRQVPDIWVGMDLYRLLAERADLLNLEVNDVIMNAIEAEVGYPVEAELFPGAA